MTNFKFTNVIDELTKNTAFPAKLVSKKKAIYENNELVYNLVDDDFDSSTLSNLEYIREELSLQNNNWGLLKYDSKYERTAAYCARIYNKENKLVFEVGSNYTGEGLALQSGKVAFEVAFKKSKIKGKKDTAVYTLNEKPVTASPEINENGDLVCISIGINLEELTLEMPLWLDKELCKDEATFWAYWNKGEVFLIAQKPNYAKKHQANKVFTNVLEKNLFPKEGVAMLLCNPENITFEKKDGSGSFQQTVWDVLSVSHDNLEVVNSYTKKDGSQVNDQYTLGELKKIQFSVTKYGVSKQWSNTGMSNCLMIVWFHSKSKMNELYIPQHIGYILSEEDSEDAIPDGFIKTHSKFLEKCSEMIDELTTKIITQNEQEMLQLVGSVTMTPTTLSPEANEFVNGVIDEIEDLAAEYHFA